MRTQPSHRLFDRMVSRLAGCISAALFASLLLAAPASAAWTASGSGIESSGKLSVKPELLAMAGTRSSKPASSASSRTVAAAGDDDGLVFIDADSGNILGSLVKTGAISSMAMDSGGKTLFVLTDDERLREIDVAGRKLLKSYKLDGKPSGIALRETDGAIAEVLVADRNGKRLKGLDPATGAVMRTLSLPQEPAGISFNRHGALILVAARDDKIIAVDPATFKIVKTVPVPGDIRDVAGADANDLVIVVHRNKDGLSLADTAKGQVAKVIALDDDPRGVVIDHDGQRAFVITRKDDSVNVVDMVTQSPLGHYALDEQAHDAVYDPVAKKLLIALPDEKNLLRLDPEQAPLINTLNLKKRLRDIAVNNVTHEAVTVADKNDELVRIKLADRSVQSLALPEKSNRLALDTALNLAVVGFKSKELRYVDLSGAEPMLLADKVALQHSAEALAVDSSRNLTVALTEGRQDVYFVDNKARTVLGTLSLSGDAEQLAIHGRRGIAYLISESKKLHLLNLDTRALAQTVSLPFKPADIAIDEVLDVAILTTRDGDSAYVLDLASLSPAAKSLSRQDFAQRFELPRQPGDIALQTDTHTAVVVSKESDQMSLIDLAANRAQAGYAQLGKPTIAAISNRYNQALVLSSEADEVTFIDLPNPVPLLNAISPDNVNAGSAPLTLTVTGEKFVNGSKVIFGPQALATQYVDAGKLEAAVPANALAYTGKIQVMVRNPMPGGGDSAAVQFEIVANNPVLTGLAPDSVVADAQPKTLVLTGSHFVDGARVAVGNELLASAWSSAAQLSTTIPAALTGAPGVLQVSVVNPDGRASGSLPLTLTAPPVSLAIVAIEPASAAPGATVTISGKGFDPVSGNNLVKFAGATALVQSGTATQLAVTVPIDANSGAVSVSNSLGTALGPDFTVVRDQDFSLTVNPAALTLYQGAGISTTIQLGSTGVNDFTGLAALSVSGLPPGVTAEFAPRTVSAYQTGTLKLKAEGTAAPGSFAATVTARYTANGVTLVKTSPLKLAVEATGGQSGIKGRFVTPDGRGVAGVIVRADLDAQPQPQTVSDAAGNFQLAGLPPGQLTLRLDATPANPLYPIWPYSVTLADGGMQTLADWVINPPPADDKFIPIDNAAQDQAVTDERFPGFAVKLPAGVSIVGWDGVKKTRIAVEKLTPDKLPVSAPPFAMKEAYQLYFGSAMGGIPSQPIPVSLPNVTDLEPGEQTEIWWFDGSPMGGAGEWKVAGLGTVSADGKTVDSNPGVGIPRFCGVCGLVSVNCPARPKPDQNSCEKDGNPIDLFTGKETPSTSGLSCGGRAPIDTGLRYTPVDAFNNTAGTLGSFGYGWTSDYDIAFLPFAGVQKRLVMPGGQFVNFVDDGTGVYRPFDNPGFEGAAATHLGGDRWEVRLKGGERWQFDPFPGIAGLIRGGPPLFVTHITDPNGNAATVARQGNGRITAIGAQERHVDFEYGSHGFVSRMRDHSGRTTTFDYVELKPAPRPIIVTKMPDTQHRIARITDAEGRATEYTYVPAAVYFNDEPPCAGCVPLRKYACEDMLPPDSEYGIASIRYPDSDTPTINTHSTNKVVRQITSKGEEYRFAYRRVGACVAKLSEPAQAGGGAIRQWAFTCTAGQPVNQTYYTGDKHGYQQIGACPEVESHETHQQGWRFYGGTVTETTVTNPDGSAYTVRFDASRRAVERIDEQGQRVQSEYDSANRLVKRTDALGRSWKYAYDAQGNRIAETDPLNRRTEYAYDGGSGKVSRRTRKLADGAEVSELYRYDANGNLTGITDALGNFTELGYDGKGQLSTVTGPGERTFTFGYNAPGDVAAVTDPLGNETRFASDDLGRMTGVTDALGHTGQTEYNALGQVTRLTDALDQDTQLGYDAAGRMTGVTNPAGVAIEQYDYDAQGRVVAVRDALGQAVRHEYDAANRLARMTDRNGRVTAYQYERHGGADRIVRIDHPDGVETRSYDAAGRLAEIRSEAPGSAGTLRWTYDGGDRIVQAVSDTAAGTHAVGYEYDNLDRVTRVTVNGADPTDYAWDKAGRLSAIRYRGQSTTYQWDAAGRLTQRTLPNGIVQTFQYDAADRLTQLEYRRSDGSVLDTLGYTYNAAGLRTSRSSGTDSVQETPMEAVYDAANRMTRITLQPGAAGARTYQLTHDANGNLATKENVADSTDRTEYTWDARNRLVGIVRREAGQTVTASFAYDPLGRRVHKTVDGHTVQYLYDGRQAIGEVRDGKISATLLTSLALDDVIARYGEAGTRTYLSDALGSVIAQSRDDQSVENYYAYTPYGETLALGPDGGNPVRYTGRENDGAGTGLYFYRARYYDPVLKRFISSDPIGLRGGPNIYTYVEGNPVSRTDPDGLQAREATMPGWWREITTPTTSPGYCGSSGECAAGLPPSKSEFRPTEEIEQSMCNRICNIFGPGNVIPALYPWRGAKKAIGGESDIEALRARPRASRPTRAAA